jgi:hypothetical protein
MQLPTVRPALEDLDVFELLSNAKTDLAGSKNALRTNPIRGRQGAIRAAES